MDPRRLLESAAENRCAVEVQPRGSAWRRGDVVRVERGGVVLRLPGGIDAGVDVRCWLTIDGQPYTFEASVLRAGVPIPDRSQDGVLLGFMDGWQRADARPGALVLEVLPHNGGPVSLTSGAARIVELSPAEWTVAAPLDFPLVFVEQGGVRLRIALPDRAPMELAARVGSLRHGEHHLLYTLRIESVEDTDRYRDLVAGMRAALAL
jgi:hypothetical protein